MADRFLTWYIEQPDETRSRQGPTYILDKTYVPMALRIYAGNSPDSGDMEIDIKDDGTTIFGRTLALTGGDTAFIANSTIASRPTLSKRANVEDWWEDFNDRPNMEIHSEVSLNFVKCGGAKDVTIVLELAEEYEETEEQR